MPYCTVSTEFVIGRLLPGSGGYVIAYYTWPGRTPGSGVMPGGVVTDGIHIKNQAV